MRPNNLLVALVCGLIPATAGAEETLDGANTSFRKPGLQWISR